MFKWMFGFLNGMFLPEPQQYYYEHDEHVSQDLYQEEVSEPSVHEAFLEDQMMLEVSYED